MAKKRRTKLIKVSGYKRRISKRRTVKIRPYYRKVRKKKKYW